MKPTLFQQTHVNLASQAKSEQIMHTLGPSMLLPGEIAQIRAEIKRLEKVRNECIDSGIRKRIEAWIEEHKQKLESKQSNH